MHQLRTEGRSTAHQERRFTHLRSHRIQAPRDHYSGKTKVLFPRIHRQLPQGVRTLRRVVETIHVFYARHCNGIHRICDNLGRVVPVIVRSRARRARNTQLLNPPACKDSRDPSPPHPPNPERPPPHILHHQPKHQIPAQDPQPPLKQNRRETNQP